MPRTAAAQAWSLGNARRGGIVPKLISSGPGSSGTGGPDAGAGGGSPGPADAGASAGTGPGDAGSGTTPGAGATTPCPCASATLTSQTFATVPSNRARTRIGVGEEVTLTYSCGSATWSKSGGGTLSSTSGASVTFTAPDRAGSVTITATGSGCTKSITLTIVEPSGLVMRRASGSGVRHTTGRPEAGFRATPHFQPADVSFYNIETREQDVAAVASGAYSVWSGIGHSPNSSFISSGTAVAGVGTPMNGVDNIYSGDPGGSPPFAPGVLTFNIPWEFRVGAGTPKVFATVQHRQSINAAGDVTISKGGVSVTARRGDPTTSW